MTLLLHNMKNLDEPCWHNDKKEHPKGSIEYSNSKEIAKLDNMTDLINGVTHIQSTVKDKSDARITRL